MARSEKTTVDYYPFLCKEGETMFVIDRKYGNDGYATWFKILRQLAVTSNHFIDLSKGNTLLFLASKCNISGEKLEEIITDLCALGEFDEELWSDKIVWSDKFIENIQDAYKKRINKCITKEELIEFLNPSSMRKLDKSIREADRNTHTIVDYTILKNTKVDDDTASSISKEVEVKKTNADWLKELKPEAIILKFKNNGNPSEKFELN